MHTIADLKANRLEKVLVKDKSENPAKMAQVLKSDLLILLNNYCDVEDIDINFDIGLNGYEIQILAKASRLKSFGVFPK